MKAYTPIRLTTRAALALVLMFCCAVVTASAQPADQTTLAGQLETIEQALTTPSARAKLTVEEWQRFSYQLTGALASGHDGLRQGALRMIIQYGEYLEFERSAVLDVVRIYRNHRNENMRRMAVVALGQMRDDWGIDFLVRSARFEKTPKVRHTLLSVLDELGAVKLGPAKVTG